MRMTTKVTATWIAASWLAGALAAQTGDGAELLDNAGVLFRAQVAEAGASLPDGSVIATGSALVIEERSAGASRQHLVPSTDDAAIERVPLLLYDRTSGRLTVVWERHADELIRVLACQLDAQGGWSEIHTILQTGDGDQPIIRSLTQEASIVTLPDSRTAEIRRQLIHFMWWDTAADAPLRYKPMILIDGEIVGPVPDLGARSLYELTGEPADVGISPSLGASVTLSTIDRRTLSATFIDPEFRRLVGLELRVEPLEARLFADRVVARFAETFGAFGSFTDELRAEIVAIGLRAEIVAIGSDLGLDGVLLEFLATTAEGFSSAYFDLHPHATADDWLSALHTFLNELLTSILGTGEEGGGSIQIGAGGDGPGQFVDVRKVVDLPAPETGDGPTRTYVGRSGAVVVGWHEAATHRVLWVEATGDPEAPWTTPRTLVLEGGVDLDRADALLRQRVQ